MFGKVCWDKFGDFKNDISTNLRPSYEAGDFRNNCNPSKMEKLKERCEILVDTCLSPLALQLTDKELLELRQKIEGEICSYLTCDKYWSVEDRRDRHNLAAIILIVTTIAILYLIFVYHLVWSWY